MKWEQMCQNDLEEVLDEYFPKDHPPQDSGRAKALVLFALAMGSIRKTIKAFGGCEKCWGKLFTTQTIDGTLRMNFCSCERGKQLADLWEKR